MGEVPPTIVANSLSATKSCKSLGLLIIFTLLRVSADGKRDLTIARALKFVA